ncbi:hypothetical protein CCACVL1_14624 [Corchorus capsularis]|uniref:Uncharacterized protein n=1 Tax=Corchorus capsularis TaxID=210143 RepID=A0A1R3I6M2_COCAP|nr:hypothetical protein CCACVL1_14624 [Corchorus capsularis]
MSEIPNLASKKIPVYVSNLEGGV